MKLSSFIQAQSASNHKRVLSQAVAEAKNAVAEVYVNSSLRKLSQDSPFLALGINQSQWEQMPAKWRRKVRDFWTDFVSSRKDIAELADTLSAQLDLFLSESKRLPLDFDEEVSE